MHCSKAEPRNQIQIFGTPGIRSTTGKTIDKKGVDIRQSATDFSATFYVSVELSYKSPLQLLAANDSLHVSRKRN